MAAETGNVSGQILFALMLGVLLAASLAWVVAWRYRQRMVVLMSAAPGPDVLRAGADTAPVAQPTAGLSIAAPESRVSFDLVANRHATIFLLAVLTAMCLVVALTQSWLTLTVQLEALSWNRMWLLGVVYAWPMVMAWGLTLRWPWRRVIGGIALYIAAMVLLVMLRSNDQQRTLVVIGWLATEVGVPLAVTLLISASGRIRAVAPYLLLPALILSAASVLALAALSADVTHGLVVAPLVRVFGAYGTIALCALTPWVLLAWPVYALGRRIAAAYRNKRFSDLGYLFAVYWLVVLMSNAVKAFAGAGVAGLTLLLPWLWIPVSWWLLARWQAKEKPAPAAPPTLLVLRVFQQDALLEHLFDQVIERWRFGGNTLLIAGTDLVSRTLDPDDLFTFLDGRLDQRFINAAADVPQRFADFDLARDPDGRYRVNECYCRDASWEAALAALVERCHVVLMDLRGFQAKNRGCRHELGVLAQADNLQRVVVLYDDRTDRQTAVAETGLAPANRFFWIDAGRMSAAKTREVLAALYPSAPTGRAV